MSTTAEARLALLWETPKTAWGWFSTVDHKQIGRRYLVTAMLFLIAGGIEALLIRLQLALADQRLVTAEAYNQIFTMHGVTMIFWYAAPILAGFGNYLVPLMIGARDMAFPRLNAFTYWSFLFSGLFLYGSLFFADAPHGGWFAYVPYTSQQYSPGYGMDFYALALIFLTVSTTAGSINFITRLLLRQAESRHRRAGLDRLRRADPSHQVLGSVRNLAGDVCSPPQKRQWRAYHAASFPHARNCMAGAAPVFADELLAAFHISACYDRVCLPGHPTPAISQ